MSENITHIAVCDDCLRLMSRITDICDIFKQVANEHLDIARLGSITRSTDNFNPELLRRLRDNWNKRQPKDNFELKLAFSLGALCHRAADRTMKPVFREIGPDDKQSPKDISIYHDVFLFREIYKEGFEKPYSPEMFGMKTQFEEHFRVLLQRALLSIHTFIPDVRNAEEWLDKLFSLRQEFGVKISRYAEIYYHPDPEKTRRYITDVNFYDADDNLIKLARSTQFGEKIGDDAIERALTFKNKSKYAQALYRGLGYLKTANKFFIDKMGFEDMKTALDIGKPDA